MNYSQWVRDPSKVHACLHEQPDKSVICSKSVKIYVPERFIEKQLAKIESETYILAIFAIVVDDKYYGVSSACAMMRIKPSLISTVKFGENAYLEFSFEPGSVVIANTDLVKQDVLVYRIFDEILAKGNVPWYLRYDDRARLFESAGYHAGMDLSRSHAILEMIAAATARDPKDRSQYYRQTVQSPDDQITRPPVAIALRDITLGTTNTTSKLLGSYWNQGLDSALVNPSTKVQNIENLLRR